MENTPVETANPFLKSATRLPWKKLSLFLLASLLLGSVLAWLFPGGNPAAAAAGTTILTFLCLGGLAWVPEENLPRNIFWLVILAFILRVGVGSALLWSLPRYGYDTVQNRGGYVFNDAYARDNDAWDLAAAGQPLQLALAQQFVSDQYGGLLLLSAAVYRVFSPDFHRPYLIYILSAAAAAWGVLLLWYALRRRFSRRAAFLGAAILAMYPECVLLGSSQMREPFLIALSAALLWAVLAWPRRRGAALAAFFGGAAGLLVFSYRMALPAVGVTLVLFLLDRQASSESNSPGKRWGRAGWGWLLIAGGTLAMVLASWNWLASSAAWDFTKVSSESGMIDSLLESAPPRLQVLFRAAYGVAQPVFPAALVDSAPLAWWLTGILRGLGWYLLLPVLVYGGVRAWTAPRSADSGLEKRLLVWLALVVLLWTLVASIRAGGSQWDNPRYRTTFLVWFAILAAWAWEWGRSHRDPWLGRTYAVFGAWVAIFLHWYLSRAFPVLRHQSFQVVVAACLVAAGLIVGGGWAWERWKTHPTASR